MFNCLKVHLCSGAETTKEAIERLIEHLMNEHSFMTFKWNTEYDDWIYPPQVYDEKVAPHFQNFLLGITSIRRLKKAELDEMKGFVNGFLSSQGFLVSTIETAVFNAPKTPAHLPNAPSFFAREAMRRG